VLCNIRSIAFSQALNFEQDEPVLHWETAEHYAPGIITKILAEPWEKDTFFNVNFPDCLPHAVKGIKCVAQGKHHFYKELLREDNSNGEAEYWVHWGDAGADPRRPDVDIHWMAEGYVTVTPLSLDLTHYGLLEKLKAKIEG